MKVNLACNTLLPAEPGIKPQRRPVGQGRPRAAPSQSRSVKPSPVHEFTVLYSFNDDYLEYAANQVVTEAAAYAKR